MGYFANFIKKTGCERRIETVFSARMHARAVRIVVFGAGAMGSFFGGLLSRRYDVTLIGRAEHMAAIRARGLRITGKTAMIARPRTATRIPHGVKPELILVTTKSYDTDKAMVALRPFADEALFVTFQNGLGNAEAIAKVAKRVVAGTTTHGVTSLGPGEIRHAGVGETVLGAWVGIREADLVRLRDLLADAGVVVRAAARHGIPVPLNRALLALVRARESTGREASDGNVTD